MEEYETDYMDSNESASYLAAIIRRYWSVRGLSPKVWVEKMNSKATGVGVLYVVRSDMQDGKPVNG